MHRVCLSGPVDNCLIHCKTWFFHARAKAASSQRMNAPVQYSARRIRGILGPSGERRCSLQTKGNHMTKLIISTLAAAIALGSVSTTFAAPKQTQNQKVQEPIYFTLATGEN